MSIDLHRRCDQREFAYPCERVCERQFDLSQPAHSRFEFVVARANLWFDRFEPTKSTGETRMRLYKLIAAAAVMSFIALPATAQTGAKGGNNDHHYTGGPKSEVPHHIGKKESSGSKSSAGGSHHYSGGPKTDLPHHMGPKKEQ
jgi:hypothetical protein